MYALLRAMIPHGAAALAAVAPRLRLTATLAAVAHRRPGAHGSQLPVLCLLRITILVALIAWGQAVPAQNEKLWWQGLQAGEQLPNLCQVSKGIWRGGQPTAGGLLSLKQAGIKTIVNLRNEQVLVRDEEIKAHLLGLKFINIPLDVFNPPSDEAVRQFMHVVSEPENRPVFVHCLLGQDRTGVMIALYRVEKEGWTAIDAYEEMKARGFLPFLGVLSRAVFDHAARLGRGSVQGLPLRDVISGFSRR